MSVIRFWRKDFSYWLTQNGLRRLLRLAKRLHGDEDKDCRVIDQALALYAVAVDWPAQPFFSLDSVGDYQRINLTDYILGPCGRLAYQRDLYCSWREWRAIRRLLAKSGDENISVMFERSLELFELVLDKKLPELFMLDKELELVPTEIIFGTRLVF
ncbi:MAG: hypothetical protein V1738_00745 [Patescibacteria group bacterium]